MAAAYSPESQLGNKGIEPLAFSQDVSALPIELTVPSVGWKQRHSHCQHNSICSCTTNLLDMTGVMHQTHLVEVALEVRLGLAALIKFRDLQHASV